MSSDGADNSNCSFPFNEFPTVGLARAGGVPTETFLVIFGFYRLHVSMFINRYVTCDRLSRRDQVFILLFRGFTNAVHTSAGDLAPFTVTLTRRVAFDRVLLFH